MIRKRKSRLYLLILGGLIFILSLIFSPRLKKSSEPANLDKNYKPKIVLKNYRQFGKNKQYLAASFVSKKSQIPVSIKVDVGHDHLVYSDRQAGEIIVYDLRKLKKKPLAFNLKGLTSKTSVKEYGLDMPYQGNQDHYRFSMADSDLPYDLNLETGELETYSPSKESGPSYSEREEWSEIKTNLESYSNFPTELEKENINAFKLWEPNLDFRDYGVINLFEQNKGLADLLKDDKANIYVRLGLVELPTKPKYKGAGYAKPSAPKKPKKLHLKAKTDRGLGAGIKHLLASCKTAWENWQRHRKYRTDLKSYKQALKKYNQDQKRAQKTYQKELKAYQSKLKTWPKSYLAQDYFNDLLAWTGKDGQPLALKFKDKDGQFTFPVQSYQDYFKWRSTIYSSLAEN